MRNGERRTENGERRMNRTEGPPGAVPVGEGAWRFQVWAPRARKVEVRLTEPLPRQVQLQPGPHGLFEAVLEDVPPEALYLFKLDNGRERPDPASRCQPRGVHGPS